MLRSCLPCREAVYHVDELSTMSTDQLSEHAERLASMVGRFKLRGDLFPAQVIAST